MCETGNWHRAVSALQISLAKYSNKEAFVYQSKTVVKSVFFLNINYHAHKTLMEHSG
jgi:hypothetical protein